MKALIVTIVVVALLALLFATNPDAEDHSRYLRQQMANEVSDEDELAEAVLALFGGLAEGILARATSRDDYLFFSVYTTDLGTDELVVLGILGNFVVLQDG